MANSIHDTDGSLEKAFIKSEPSSIAPMENSLNHEDKMCEKASANLALDWEGDDDKANPLNWPFKVRVFHTALPALYCFLM
jgi:hypothetical protein